MRGRGDVRGATQRLDVGVAANHPGARTRRIQQDAVEGAAVPPQIGRGGIGGGHGDWAGFGAMGAGSYANTEIGQDLHISGVTVKSHIGRIFLKLGLRDRAAAIVYAFDHGIVTAGS